MSRWQLVLLIVGIAAIVMLLRLQHVGRFDLESSVTHEQSVTQETDRERRSPDAVAGGHVVRDVVATQGDAAQELDDSGGDANLVVVEGRVIVVDENGREHERESGNMTLSLAQSPDAQALEADVCEGAWRISVPRDAELVVQHLVLADRATVVEEPRAVVSTGAPLTIHARWPPRLVLRVVDRVTRVDLQGVTVVCAQDFRSFDHVHPGSYDRASVVVDGASSPIPLEYLPSRLRDGWSEVLWVRAPAHAWGRIEIDHAVGGERVLELFTAAELEVTLSNYPTPETQDPAAPPVGELSDATQTPRRSPAMLRVRELVSFDYEREVEREMAWLSDVSPGQSHAELRRRAEEVVEEDVARPRGRVHVEVTPNTEAPTVVQDLMPGDYQVSVEIGSSFDNPTVLGSERVTLVAGARTSVTLVLADAPLILAPVRLEGTLSFVPAATDEGDVTIHFSLLGRPDVESGEIQIDRRNMTPAGNRLGEYRWSAGRVVPGKYQVAIHDRGWGRVIEVPEAGLRDLALVLGELADVCVHVRDSVTGEAVVVASVDWFALSLENADANMPLPIAAVRNEASATYDFSAPVGSCSVMVFDQNWSGSLGFEVKPGRNEVTVPVTRTCGVILVLKDGDHLVPLTPSAASQIEAMRLDGDGYGSYDGDDRGAIQIWVSTPGRYEVRLPSIAGYAPIEAFEVDVAKAQHVRREIVLHAR